MREICFNRAQVPAAAAVAAVAAVVAGTHP